MTEREQDGLNLQIISSVITDGTGGDENTSEMQSGCVNDRTVSTELKSKIYRNVIAISIAFSVYFIGIFPVDIIQNSLELDQQLRVASLGIHTSTILIQTLFLNSLYLEVLGTRRAILVGIALEMVYVGANMHPRWWTLIPAAIISGIGRPLMRTAGSTLIAKLATFYATTCHKLNRAASTTWNFFFIYFLFISSAKVIGDLITSGILGTGLQKYNPSEMKRAGNRNLTSAFQFCGPNFCDKTPNSTFMLIDGLDDWQRIDFKFINELGGISLGCLVLSSVIMLLLVNSVETLTHKHDGPIEPSDQSTRTVSHYLMDTILSWKNPMQTLLLPLLLYNGMDSTFFLNDFARKYVFCLFGNQMVGSVMAWFRLTTPIAVCVFSIFKRASCHLVPFTIAYGVHLGTAISLLYPSPENYNSVTSFVITAIWGIGSGLWPYCLSAFSAIILDKQLEVAFSNYYTFETLGAALNYILGYFLCAKMKIYILTSLLSVGFLGYVVVEILRYRQYKKNVNA